MKTRILSRLRTGVTYEWVLIAFVAPLLIFPNLKPRWTVLALAALVFCWLLRLVVRGEAWPVTPFNGALLLFVLMLFISVLVSAIPELTLPKATGLILGLALMRVLGFTVRNRRSLLWAWTVLLVVGLGIVGIGLLSTRWSGKVPFVRPLMATLPQVLVHLPEAPAGGVNPNELGWVAAFYTPLLGGALLNVNVRARKRMWIPLSVLLLLLFLFSTGVLLLTQSRSGWFGGFGGVILLIVLSVLSRWTAFRRKVRIVIGVATSAVLIGALASLASTWGQQEIIQPLIVLFQQGIGSTEVGRIDFMGRLEIWSRALYALQDFPFTGIGLGTFRQVIPLFYPYFYILPHTLIPDAHNLLLQAGVDFGFPGLIAYLALILLAFWTLLSRWRKQGWERMVIFSLLGGLLGIHLYGFTDTLSFGAKPGVLFWMAMGLVTTLPSLQSDQTQTPGEIS